MLNGQRKTVGCPVLYICFVHELVMVAIEYNLSKYSNYSHMLKAFILQCTDFLMEDFNYKLREPLWGLNFHPPLITCIWLSGRTFFFSP